MNSDILRLVKRDRVRSGLPEMPQYIFVQNPDYMANPDESLQVAVQVPEETSFRHMIQRQIMAPRDVRAALDAPYMGYELFRHNEYLHALAFAPELVGLLFEQDENPPAQRSTEGISQDLNELASEFMGLFRSQEEPQHPHQQ